MYQIDVASVAPALPAPAAGGAPGFFTNGDVVGGEEATVLPADFMNMLMMELLNVVQAAGIAPSKSVYTQVRDAIGMAGSIGSPGYLKLPLGLILQWGIAPIPVTGTSSSGANVTFPIAFPTQFLCAVSSADASASSSWGWLGVKCQSATQTGMQVVADTANPSNPIEAGKNGYWIALGR